MRIAWARLHCQRLAAGRMARAADVVRWMGAVQSQEYALAKWGLALRLRRASDASVERAFTTGAILRTHVMRPTWHFVAPEDIRWMLALTAPRVRAVLASYDHTLGIDAKVVVRANRTLATALAGGAQLTRAELKAALARAGVPVDGPQRLARVIMHAELDAVICSGARRGKQFTYALLDDRVPPARTPSREESLAELARRYFTSHGPAQLKDFAWWSGLTSAEARAGLEMARPDLAGERVEGKHYWFAPTRTMGLRPSRAAYLLPPYDEYLIAYKDRSAALDGTQWGPIAGRHPFAAPVVLDGRVVGEWKRIVGPGSVTITLDLSRRLGRSDARLVEDAARRHGEFLCLDTALQRVMT